MDFANPDRPLVAMRLLPIMARCGLHSRMRANHMNGECLGQKQWRAAVMAGPHRAEAMALVQQQQFEHRRQEQQRLQARQERAVRRQPCLPAPGRHQPASRRSRSRSPPPRQHQHVRDYNLSFDEQVRRIQQGGNRARAIRPPPRGVPRALPGISSPAALAPSPAAFAEGARVMGLAHSCAPELMGLAHSCASLFYFFT